MADVLDTGAGVYGGMFRDCYSLRELPPGATFAISISGYNMFYNCYTLRELPPGVTFANLVNGNSMFYNCYTLRELPSASFPAATNLQSLFQNSGIRRVKDLYIPSCTNLTNAFSGCSSLEELTFDPRMTTWETPQDINLASTRLSHAAIVNLFNSLPTIESPKTVTLTNAPGAKEVTAEDVAIATAKGWKVAGVAATTASDPGLEGPEIFTDGQVQGEPYFIDRYGNEYYGPFYKS